MRQDTTSPLVTISIGLPCVFLLGKDSLGVSGWRSFLKSGSTRLNCWSLETYHGRFKWTLIIEAIFFGRPRLSGAWILGSPRFLPSIASAGDSVLEATSIALDGWIHTGPDEPCSAGKVGSGATGRSAVLLGAFNYRFKCCRCRMFPFFGWLNHDPKWLMFVVQGGNQADLLMLLLTCSQVIGIRSGNPGWNSPCLVGEFPRGVPSQLLNILRVTHVRTIIRN